MCLDFGNWKNLSLYCVRIWHPYSLSLALKVALELEFPLFGIGFEGAKKITDYIILQRVWQIKTHSNHRFVRSFASRLAPKTSEWPLGVLRLTRKSRAICGPWTCSFLSKYNPFLWSWQQSCCKEHFTTQCQCEGQCRCQCNIEKNKLQYQVVNIQKTFLLLHFEFSFGLKFINIWPFLAKALVNDVILIARATEKLAYKFLHASIGQLIKNI